MTSVSIFVSGPFFIQHRKQEGVTPVPFHAPVLYKMPFLSHAGTLQNPGRAVILRIANGVYAMQLQLLEAEFDQAPADLCCVPPAPVASIQTVANVGLPSVMSELAQAAATNQFP